MKALTDPPPRRALAIVGPTAAGKGPLSVEVAERLELPIFVCDSVKVYRGLDIGSAKPSSDLRRRLRHELVDLVDPDETFSAGDYARLALRGLEHGGAIFSGGTGFYLKTTLFTLSGWSEEGEDRKRREAFEREWQAQESHCPGAVHSALSAVDPVTARSIHPCNLVRTLRALWLCHVHGRPVSVVRSEDPPRRRVDAFVVVLDPGSEAVDAAIERRVDRMLAAGWMAEVENLWEEGYDARHKAMMSLGYRQLLDVVEGHASLADGRQAVIGATRRYARRQRTFFRHQLGIPCHWIRRADEFPWSAAEAFMGGGGRG